MFFYFQQEFDRLQKEVTPPPNARREMQLGGGRAAARCRGGPLMYHRLRPWGGAAREVLARSWVSGLWAWGGRALCVLVPAAAPVRVRGDSHAGRWPGFWVQCAAAGWRCRVVWGAASGEVGFVAGLLVRVARRCLEASRGSARSLAVCLG